MNAKKLIKLRVNRIYLLDSFQKHFVSVDIK